MFFTVFFIAVLWINIPCFVSVGEIEHLNNITRLLFRLYQSMGIFYIIIANALLCVILFLQSKFTHTNLYTYKKIKTKYDNFGNDATQLYIIGRDLDFLYDDKFKKQTDRILHLGNNCHLLCEKTQDKTLMELYNKASRQGVQVNFYTREDNIINLKGQIKIDQSGNKKAIFTSKQNKKYVLLDIDNQFLVSSILERCFEVYENKNS